MARELVKRIDMALHIQELCAKHDIRVRYQSLSEKVPRYYADQNNRTICIRPTKNTGYYVSALHELGHLLGINQTVDNDTLETAVTSVNVVPEAALPQLVPEPLWSIHHMYDEVLYITLG